MRNFYLNDLKIHDNTQDIGFVIFNNYQGLEYPDARLSTYNKPGQHGSVVSNHLYGGRSIHLPGRISANNIADYQRRRRDLQNAARIIKDVNTVSQPVLLSFLTMDNLALQCEVYYKSLQFINQSLEHCTYILELFAPDPNLYSQTMTSYALGLPTSSGLVYPVIYPVTYPAITGGQVTITNEGDSNAPFKATFNGPLTSPFFIKNLTTGEAFSVNLTLGDSDQLEVDMANKAMVLNGSTDALEYFDLTNIWMELIPGDNIIQLGAGLSSGTGSVIISFRSAYLGK